MRVVGAPCNFEYGPTPGASGCFRARLFHASVAPRSGREHLKIAFFFRTLVKGDRLAKRSQKEHVKPTASKKKKKVEEAAAVHDLCNDDKGKAVSRRSSRIEIQARNPGAAVLLHFPSRDAKGYISLTFADVQRLESGAHGAPSKTLLLNDNLVDFYIKYLSGPPQQLCAKFIPGLDEKSRSRVHMFSAFFLKRLTKTITKGLDMGAMMKWVSGVDLFAKDFLFVPVHELKGDGHWALAVICFPGLVTRPPPPPPSAERGPAAIDGGGIVTTDVSGGCSSGSSSSGVGGSSGNEGSGGEGSGASSTACVAVNKVLFGERKKLGERKKPGVAGLRSPYLSQTRERAAPFAERAIYQLIYYPVYLMYNLPCNQYLYCLHILIK